MKFWIYLERELSNLQPEFERIFKVDNLYHDYENIWEWLESKDRNSLYYLNISRPHDWNKGIYDKPILIKVESNEGKQLDESIIARMIRDELRCDVFAGEISGDENDGSQSIEIRKY